MSAAATDTHGLDTPAHGMATADRDSRRRGWFLYGWGAHAFSTTVLAVFLGPYLTDIAPWQFYALGCAIGVVLGGTQALSRSLYAQIIPIGQEGQYFGLYEISQNGTAWIGSLTVALAIQFTDSYRLAIASLVAFFVVGLVLLSRTNLAHAIAEAGNPVPERL